VYRSTAVVSVLSLSALLTACLEHPLKTVTYDSQEELSEPIELLVKKDVDILFVIDNSWSMGEEQALLSRNFGAFVDVLEQKGVEANYRIGVTTTDSDSPRCDTTPENGRLVLSSCVDRVGAGEFTAQTTEGKIDRTAACTDLCAFADAELPITPTATVADPTPRARRWIESTGGRTNLPAGVTAVDAFQCFGPQGVAGCGMESPLESMRRALAASSDPASPNFGFLRPDALLAVVFITDETDCSINPAHEQFFYTQSDPVFSDGGPPDSASCWRMGVACEGSGPAFAGCHAIDFAPDGQPAADAADAMLVPVRDYVDFLQAIEDDKRARDGKQEVIVAMLAGVPPGYEHGDVPISYRDDVDPAFVDTYGVSPGCTFEEDGVLLTRAVPPVREREFAEAFELRADPDVPEPNLYSLCQSDYSDALSAIADRIRQQLAPICMPGCARDVDESTDALDSNCKITEKDGVTGTRREVPRCVEVAGAWQPPAGETLCFAELTDRAGGTASALDDMSADCVADGHNLEFKLVGVPPPSAAPPVYEATCALSPNKPRDCPDLD
jgi:hypothetical protein